MGVIRRIQRCVVVIVIVVDDDVASVVPVPIGQPALSITRHVALTAVEVGSISSLSDRVFINRESWDIHVEFVC